MIIKISSIFQFQKNGSLVHVCLYSHDICESKYEWCLGEEEEYMMNFMTTIEGRFSILIFNGHALYLFTTYTVNLGTHCISPVLM